MNTILLFNLLFIITMVVNIMCKETVTIIIDSFMKVYDFKSERIMTSNNNPNHII